MKIMEDAEVIEITTVRNAPSSNTKRKWDDVVSEPNNIPVNSDLLQRAAQLKRRLEFCEKEKEELAKRLKDLENQLTTEQRCKLDVKLEHSETTDPLLCIGDDDVVFIPPEHYSPKKKRKLEGTSTGRRLQRNNGLQLKEDISITFYKPATNLPHARENCMIHKFVQGNVTTASISCNELYCEQCFCFVCDASVKECDSWKFGSNPHCNAFAKNIFWEKLKKMKKRKQFSVEESLLKYLPAGEQTQDILDAAAEATELVNSLRDRIENTSSDDYSRSSSPVDCYCDCHYDSWGSNSEDCNCCMDNHPYPSDFGCYYDRDIYSTPNFSSSVSDAVNKAKEHLARSQPVAAALILDSVTLAFLAVDNHRDRLSYGQVSSSVKFLQNAWIDVMLCPQLPDNVQVKVKERLKNSIVGSTIWSPEICKLKVILEIKSWKDPTLVKCLAGKLAKDLIKEDKEVADARIAYLEKNKRYEEALFYILGCQTIQNGISQFGEAHNELANGKPLASTVVYKKKFALMLAKSGKVKQALHILSLPQETELPKDFVQSGAIHVGSFYSSKLSQSLLTNLDFAEVKDLLSAIVGNEGSETGTFPLPSAIPEDKMKQALTCILSSTQLCYCLKNDMVLVWYVDTFCESSLKNESYKANQKEVFSQVGKILIKAKDHFVTSDDLKPPPDVDFKVFVVELLASLTASVYRTFHSYHQNHITSVLNAFKRKKLLWGALSVIVSPLLWGKVTPKMLSFVLTSMKTLGSSFIPLETIKKWIKYSTIEKCFDIASFMLADSKGKSGTEGCTLKRYAVLFVEEIAYSIEVFLKALDSKQKERMRRILRKMRKEFCPVASQVGMKSLHVKILELNFKNDPSHVYSNYEELKRISGSDWSKMEPSLLNFLRKKSGSRLLGCVEVFGRLQMFSDLKTVLNKAAYTDNYPDICKKITSILSKLNGEEARQFVDTCTEWLGKTLCNGTFYHWRFSCYATGSVEPQMKSCLKAICAIRVDAFNSILSTSITQVSEIFCRNTVHEFQRLELVKWLKDIKSLYSEEGQLTAWSWAFYHLTAGPLKRKQAVIRLLRDNRNLQSGTTPYSELVRLNRNRYNSNIGSSSTGTSATSTRPNTTASGNSLSPVVGTTSSNSQVAVHKTNVQSSTATSSSAVRITLKSALLSPEEPLAKKVSDSVTPHVNWNMSAAGSKGNPSPSSNTVGSAIKFVFVPARSAKVSLARKAVRSTSIGSAGSSARSQTQK